MMQESPTSSAVRSAIVCTSARSPSATAAKTRDASARIASCALCRRLSRSACSARARSRRAISTSRARPSAWAPCSTNISTKSRSPPSNRRGSPKRKPRHPTTCPSIRSGKSASAGTRFPPSRRPGTQRFGPALPCFGPNRLTSSDEVSRQPLRHGGQIDRLGGVHRERGRPHQLRFRFVVAEQQHDADLGANGPAALIQHDLSDLDRRSGRREGCSDGVDTGDEFGVASIGRPVSYTVHRWNVPLSLDAAPLLSGRIRRWRDCPDLERCPNHGRDGRAIGKYFHVAPASSRRHSLGVYRARPFWHALCIIGCRSGQNRQGNAGAPARAARRQRKERFHAKHRDRTSAGRG